jgi:hypothetical protein
VKAKEVDVDLTELMEGKLLFSLVTQDHLPLFRVEATIQGLVEGANFEKDTGIMELKKNFKEKLGLDEKEKAFHYKHQMLNDVCYEIVSELAIRADELGRPTGDKGADSDDNSDVGTGSDDATNEKVRLNFGSVPEEEEEEWCALSKERTGSA